MNVKCIGKVGATGSFTIGKVYQAQTIPHPFIGEFSIRVMSNTGQWSIAHKDFFEAVTHESSDHSIDTVGLSSVTLHVLKSHGISTIDKLKAMSEKSLYMLRNMNHSRVNEVMQAIQSI